MRADLFYQSHSDKQALSLTLVSQQQWEKDELELSSLERNLCQQQQFKGNLGELSLIYDKEGLLRKVYVGSGKNNDQEAMAHAASRLPAGLYCPTNSLSLFAMVNWALAQYRFVDYKKQDIMPRVLLISEAQLAEVKTEVQAIFLVRNLINSPANAMGPKELGTAVAALAREYGAEYEEWVGDELLQANFPAIHAVGRAAANKPRLLSFTWGKVNHPPVTLVGKGVCFDSGGLDIKTSSGMRLMKKDMGGAAHALGLAQWIMSKALPLRLQVLIPAVENVIGSDAYKPGDVLTMRNGLTVEIDNTDAEGRLVLADALVKACEANPELIIDFATLTGAARVAVGTEIAAMFSNDNHLAAALLNASQETSDPIWELPLFEAYEGLLDSSIADMVNSSASPYGGAITAALFLKRFILNNISWVHFDIMAWNVANKPGKPEGGEAMAIRALAYYLQKKYGQES